MCVDERVVARDVGAKFGDVHDAAHIGGEVMDRIDGVGGGQAVRALAKIRSQERVRGGRRVLWFLEIRSAAAVSALYEISDQVMPNESARSRNERAWCALLIDFCGHMI